MSKKSFKNPAMNFISQESIEKANEGTAKELEGQVEVMTTGETRIYQQPEAPEGYKLNPAFIETKSKRVQLLLQPSVHEAIKKIATDEGTSFNDYVSALLKEHAESRGL